MRALVAEHRVGIEDLIWAIVVHDGPEAEIPVATLPGVSRLSVAAAAKAAKQAEALGVPAIALFPYIDGAQ